ncbi:TonB-dependent receptor plug domain-containing protein [Pedobacter sp. R-06]|uniref:TonB-dependent receptor plug domain-containing protein n=1 Tax=Pedobacter sp. R-06 TaxID=3404051 RepID=UPI003CEB5296
MKNIIALTIMMGISLVGFAQKPDSTKTSGFRLRGTLIAGIEPIVVIDGNKQFVRGTTSLSEIDKENIEAINILKDSLAVAKYGADGFAGVIEITTKNTTGSNLLKGKPIKPIDLNLNGKASGFHILPPSDDQTPVKKRYLLKRDFDTKAKPLYVVDGKEVPDLNLNEESIESIEVLKDSSARSLHGDKGKNGVVIITTKKPKATPKKN